jgi:hypothetical protein
VALARHGLQQLFGIRGDTGKISPYISARAGYPQARPVRVFADAFEDEPYAFFDFLESIKFTKRAEHSTWSIKKPLPYVLCSSMCNSYDPFSVTIFRTGIVRISGIFGTICSSKQRLWSAL